MARLRLCRAADCCLLRVSLYSTHFLMQQSYWRCSPFSAPLQMLRWKPQWFQWRVKNSNPAVSFLSSCRAAWLWRTTPLPCRTGRWNIFAFLFNAVGQKSEGRTCTYGETRCTVSTQIHTTSVLLSRSSCGARSWRARTPGPRSHPLTLVITFDWCRWGIYFVHLCIPDVRHVAS